LTTGLFRIFHEEFHSRRRADEAQRNRDVDTRPSTEGLEEPVSGFATRFAKALAAMSDNQREALILISAGGFTCEDAATICGAQPKTVKSRAARARITLIRNLESDHAPAKSGNVRELWAGSVV
jgi:RNA polymerase sigma-70 factor (ECF subfamily)